MPDRSDLRISYWVDRVGGVFRAGRPTDDEFDAIARQEGYVKLDAETVKRLRAFHEERSNDEMVRSSEVHSLISPILDALGEEK